MVNLGRPLEGGTAGFTHEKSWVEQHEILQNRTSLPALESGKVGAQQSSFFPPNGLFCREKFYLKDLMREPCPPPRPSRHRVGAPHRHEHDSVRARHAGTSPTARRA